MILVIKSNLFWGKDSETALIGAEHRYLVQKFGHHHEVPGVSDRESPRTK